MNITFKRFFISLLFSDKVEKNSIFLRGFSLFLLPLRGSLSCDGKPPFLIVPQVCTMYYGGFQLCFSCACMKSPENLMELMGGLCLYSFNMLDEIYEVFTSPNS